MCSVSGGWVLDLFAELRRWLEEPSVLAGLAVAVVVILQWRRQTPAWICRLGEYWLRCAICISQDSKIKKVCQA